MFIVPVVLAATLLLFIAFLSFFMASKTSGLTAMFGRLLGLWLLFIAAVIVGGVVTAPMMGGRPYGMDMPMMRGEGMRCCTLAQPEEPAPTPPTSAQPTEPTPDTPAETPSPSPP